MNLGYYIVPEETKNGVCLDVGCNLGDFTNKYKNHFSKIYFVEPQIQLFDALQTRFLNDSNITGFNKAVWSESDEKVELLYHPNNDHGSVAVKGDFINNDWTDKVVNVVETISLEDLLNTIGEVEIDYLKIDCETSEYPFLINKNLNMFKFIGMEIHTQLGLDKYNELLNWIGQTHTLVNGDATYSPTHNKEILFKRK